MVLKIARITSSTGAAIGYPCALVHDRAGRLRAFCMCAVRVLYAVRILRLGPQTRPITEIATLLVHSKLALQRDRAAGIVMLDHLLLQLEDVLLQIAHHPAQLGILRLQLLHPVLQLRDALELPLPALGGGDPVPEPLALQLDALLRLHVDRADRGRLVAGGGRRRLRFLLHQQ